MVKEPDGSAHINFPPELGGGEDLVGFGAAVACAWEFGDFDTHAQLITWANTRYQPTAKEGEFSINSASMNPGLGVGPTTGS